MASLLDALKTEGGYAGHIKGIGSTISGLFSQEGESEEGSKPPLGGPSLGLKVGQGIRDLGNRVDTTAPSPYQGGITAVSDTIGSFFKDAEAGYAGRTPEQQKQYDELSPLVINAQKMKLTPEQISNLPADPMKAHAEIDTNLANKGKESLKNAPKAQQTAWEEFTSKVDLFAMGAAMLAGANDPGGFGVTLGKAMQVGLAVKDARTTKDAATAKSAREEARDERKVGATELTAEAAASRAQTAALANSNKGAPASTPNKGVEAGVRNTLSRDYGIKGDEFADQVTQLATLVQQARELRASGKAYTNKTDQELTNAVIKRFKDDLFEPGRFYGTNPR